MPGPARVPLEQRFWPKVDKRGPDECWPWLGVKNAHGYGKIGRGGKYGGMVRAHRVAYEIAHGPIPVGPTPQDSSVMHRCDNRCCCNPAHLKLGTHADNMADMKVKGRQTRKARARFLGEQNGAAKLTAATVREMRAAFAAGSSISDLARRFGIGAPSAHSIVRETAWKHLL